jgi:hypothetical protein
MAYFAIGLTDGTVLLYRNFEQSVLSSGSLTAVPKAKTIHESPSEPITGLGFREETPEGEAGGAESNHLFIVTTNRVLFYHVAGKGSGPAPTVLDEVGCGLGCACMERKGMDIIVAREEAIYLCGIDGRGSCFAYEGTNFGASLSLSPFRRGDSAFTGPKSSVHTFGHYVVIVSPPFIPSASAASATVRNHVARTLNAGASDITKVTVFDIDNKIVAFSGAFAEGIREVFEGWGDLYVLGSDGVVCNFPAAFDWKGLFIAAD